MGNYILSKRKPEVGDRGFIIGNRFIPIQKVNNMPSKGLIFYAPLHTNENFDKTGKPLIYSNNFTTKDGIGCFQLGNCAHVSTEHLLLGATEFTTSLFINYDSIVANNNPYLICDYSK